MIKEYICPGCDEKLCDLQREADECLNCQTPIPLEAQMFSIDFATDLPEELG